MIITLRRAVSILIVLMCFTGISSAQFDESHNNSINGVVSVDHGYNISVALDHIFISKKNNSIEISEVVVFRNEGEEIYYDRDNHTFFAISTPPDIKDLKTQIMECCLVNDEGIVYMDPMKSIKSGENFDMQISYALIPHDQKYVFNKSVIYNTTSISMFIDKKSGIDLEGSPEIIKLSGNEHKIITFNNLMTGENVSIPVKITQGSGNLYAWIGLFFLLSTGLIYCFKGRISWRRKKEATLEELEIEKRNIFKTIHGFEKHAGPESSEEYRKLMEEYRQKVIKIFIKIDNLKKHKGTNTSLPP